MIFASIEEGNSLSGLDTSKGPVEPAGEEKDEAKPENGEKEAKGPPRPVHAPARTHRGPTAAVRCGLWRRVRLSAWLRGLSFPDEAEEAAFRETLDREVIVATLLGDIAGAAKVCISTTMVYFDERRRSNGAKVLFHPSDPRTLYFAFAFVVFWIFVVTTAACLVRLLCNRLRSVDFELVAVAGTIYIISNTFLISKVTTARMYGRSPHDVWSGEINEVGIDLLSIFAVALTVTVACQAVPLRTQRLWIVPVVGILIYPVVALMAGMEMREEGINGWLYLVLTCIFSYIGARRHEAHRRTKWRALMEAAERDRVAQGVHAMSWMSCDVILQLGEDFDVVDSSPELDAFFGQAMRGERLTKVMQEGDRQAFEAAARRATGRGELQSTPSALDLPFARLGVQLGIVPVSGVRTRFMVGVSQVEHQPKLESEAMSVEMAGASRVLGNFAPSITLSATTERIFQDIERACGRRASGVAGSMKRALQEIALVGVREHWLLGAHELEVITPPLLLGKGGFGQVVWGRLRGTPVAIKVPHSTGSKEQLRLVSSICNELRLFRRVRHPNIVAFHGATIDPESGNVAMVFDVINGGTMTEYVQNVHARDTSPKKDVFLGKVLLDVSSALKYLHTMDPAIVHGDLKSGNILVALQAKTMPKASLLDFGLSRLLVGKPLPLGGTREWMAPEVQQMYSAPSESSDVYSFGLLAHFATTGVHPRASHDANSLHSRTGRLPWPESAPFRTECRLLTNECLMSWPDGRPHMSQVHSALVAWMFELDNGVVEYDKMVLCQFLPGSTWEEGLRALRDGSAGPQGVEAAASAQRHSSAREAPGAGPCMRL